MLSDSIDLLALFGVYAGIILFTLILRHSQAAKHVPKSCRSPPNRSDD